MTAPDSEPTDEHLVKEVLSGGDEAFTELMRRHKRRVLNIVARYVRNYYEPDDICQEIFIKVYQNLGKYHEDEPFEHWLSVIAINVCYNTLRQQRRGEIDVQPEHGAFAFSDTAFEATPEDKDWQILTKKIVTECKKNLKDG